MVFGSKGQVIALLADMELFAVEIDICPRRVHRFQLTHSCTEQELEPVRFLTIRCGKQGVQFLGAVCLDRLLRVFDPIRLQQRPAELVVKEECLEIGHLVRDRSGSVSFIAQYPNEPEDVSATQRLDGLLGAGPLELPERVVIGDKGVLRSGGLNL